MKKRKEEETERWERGKERGENQEEVKADRYSWTIQVAQRASSQRARYSLSLLGPGSLEPVRLVSVFASIGSILPTSSVVHPSSTLFSYVLLLSSLLVFSIVLARLSSLWCIIRRLVSSYIVSIASFVPTYFRSSSILVALSRGNRNYFKVIRNTKGLPL